MLRTRLHLFLQSCGCLQLRHLKCYPCLSSYYPLSHRLHTGFKKTHYEVLELSRTATPSEIKAAFVRLSKRYDLDKKSSDPKMHDEFVTLNAAYSVLSKSSIKQEYDIALGYHHHTVDHTQNASAFYTHQPKNTAHSKPYSWNSYQGEYDKPPYSQRRQWNEEQMRPDNFMGLKISVAALGLGIIYLFICIRDMDEHGTVRRNKKTTDSVFELEEVQDAATHHYSYSHSPQTQYHPQFTVGGTNSNQSSSGTNQSGDGSYRSAGISKSTSCFSDSGVDNASKSSLKHSETFPQANSLNKSNIPQKQRSKLLPYGIKPSTIDKAHGNGMCVVIANFTGEEEIGYLCDSADICEFFREELGWEHVYEGSMPSFKDDDQPLRNLSKSQFTQALDVVQSTLQLNGGKLDRFFLFILSHGDQDGILTLKEGSDTEKEEDKNGLPVRMKIHDIAAMFTHEKVGKLKGFPKVIFNHSCQGHELLKSVASCPSDENSVPIHRVQPRMQAPEASRAVGADVVVCEATGKNTVAYSSPSGSVYIQKTLSVWRELHKTEHFLDMMVEVNRQISVRKGRGAHPHKKDKTIPAVQMPCVHTSLTHKYYLSIPQHLQQKSGKKICKCKDRASVA